MPDKLTSAQREYIAAHAALIKAERDAYAGNGFQRLRRATVRWERAKERLRCGA